VSKLQTDGKLFSYASS